MPALDRRSFLLTGSLGLGAFAVPGFAQKHQCDERAGLHPRGRERRARPAIRCCCGRAMCRSSGDSASKMRVELSETPISRVAGGGSQITGIWRDFTREDHGRRLKPAHALPFPLRRPRRELLAASARPRRCRRAGRSASAPRPSPARTCPTASSTPTPMPRRATISIWRSTSAIISTNIRPAIIPPRRIRSPGAFHCPRPELLHLGRLSPALRQLSQRSRSAAAPPEGPDDRAMGRS